MLAQPLSTMRSAFEVAAQCAVDVDFVRSRNGVGIVELSTSRRGRLCTMLKMPDRSANLGSSISNLADVGYILHVTEDLIALLSVFAR